MIKELFLGLVDFAKKILIKLNILSDKPPTLTNQELLDNIGFPSSEIPTNYLCKLSDEIMTDPEILDPLSSEQHDHIVDQASLHKWWKFKPERDAINPFTNKKIKKMRLDKHLKKEIEEFVSQYSAINETINRISKQIEDIAAPYTNAARFKNINFREDIPNNYIDSFSKEIMTYPIKLDNKYLIDYHSLIKWWTDHPNEKFKNPYTGKLINSFERDIHLEKTISDFVAQKENESLEKQLSEVTKIVSKNDIALDYADFVKKNHLDVNSLPNKFFDKGFKNQIITHPVKIDNEYIVDYKALIQFWQEWPELKFINPFTQEKIKTINYDSKLKNELDNHFDAVTEKMNKNAEKKKTGKKAAQFQLPKMNQNTLFCKSNYVLNFQYVSTFTQKTIELKIPIR